jgi:hypothetical protein
MGKYRNNKGKSAGGKAGGRSLLEQLAWLLDFFQRKNDLPTADAKTIQQMSVELACFARSDLKHPNLKRSDLETLMDQLSIDVHTALLATNPQARTVAGLSDFDDGKSAYWLIERSSEDRAFKFVRAMKVDAHGRIQTRYICDDLLVAARWRAQDLIAQNYQLIRLCPRLRCQKFFLIRHGRQQYCSPNCEQVERNARWRREHPEKAREQRRAAYDREIAAKEDVASR